MRCVADHSRSVVAAPGEGVRWKAAMSTPAVGGVRSTRQGARIRWRMVSCRGAHRLTMVWSEWVSWEWSTGVTNTTL